MEHARFDRMFVLFFLGVEIADTGAIVYVVKTSYGTGLTKSRSMRVDLPAAPWPQTTMFRMS